jgi:short-subunit dehydrogenase
MSTNTFARQFGPWAVVTGASSGIGMAFARDVAGRGLNVVLVARMEGRLKELASEIERDHSVQTRVAAVDLAADDFLDGLRAVTDPLDVGLVVSAAGADAMGAVLKVDLDDLTAMLALNTAAHLKLAHHFGSRLVPLGRGGIQLVGSAAGMQGTPLNGNYSGAKAYIHNLGQAMNYELRKTGVHVSVSVPGPTATPGLLERTDIDLSQFPGKPMAPEKVASIGLKALVKNKPLVVTGAPNKVLDWIGRHLLSRRAISNLFGKLMTKFAPDHLRMT